MYGLDKSVDLKFLVGKELLQVCIGVYQVVLNFTAEISISIESSCRLVCEGERVFDLYANDPKSSKNLVCLLGLSIEDVLNEGRGEIRLFFSKINTLTLMDNNANTESYMIVAPSIGIVV